jgi:MoaA/NifB/PqqE/SkfB family radical SAM enzyme
MKMEEITKRLNLWFQGKEAPPEMVQIYPTNACNLKCIFCVQALGIYDLKETIKKERWFEITKEICEMGVNEILISGGGEPMMVPDITLGIMKIAKKYGVEGRIITNGTLWKDKHIKEVVEIGWEHMVFSIDGPDAKTHDYLRGVKGAFQKAIRAIKAFNRIKRELKSEAPILEFNTVLTNVNYLQIPKLIELAYSLNIKNVNVEPVTVNNPSVIKLKLNLAQREIFLNKILPEAEKIAIKYNVGTNFERLKKIRILDETGKLKKHILKKSESRYYNLPCYEPWLWPKIEANGDVWPCSSLSKFKENIATKSFKEIWYGEKFRKFREEIMKRNLPEECNNCVLTHLEINELISKNLEGVVKK